MGGKASIVGKRIIELLGCPPFQDVQYVQGLEANLLSISQICNSEFEVQFKKYLCYFLNSDGNAIIKGIRTNDNCYGITIEKNLKCNIAKIDVTHLWHQRLEHLNYRDLSKISKLVDGVPKLDCCQE